MKLDQLRLKDYQFYIDKLKLDSDKAKKFKSNFTNNLKTYKKLGQFSYDQHHCIIDHIHTYIKGENGHNARWIYIGNVKEGTDDIPHGIGIQVWDYGGIFEGYWQEGKLQDIGRHIYKVGSYYIGEYKEDNRNGEGIFYWSVGDKWYEGGWKDGDQYGQGTLYNTNGDKYTGKWSGNKGQGEISYTNGTKYTGEWDWKDGYNRHGLGTLYSSGKQVLNEGKWEYNYFKGKE